MSNLQDSLLPIGTRLDNNKYVIEKPLPSGGFGNTYLATETAFEERVAIKEFYIKGLCGRNEGSTEVVVSLPENQVSFKQHQDKFRKEARRLRKIDNEHIVKVHDLFDDNGTSYYVMDYIAGETLEETIRRTGKPLPVSKVNDILPQILDALACIHAKKLYHMDLKPGIIMMGNDGVARLIDFGASKQQCNADASSTLKPTAMAYTPGFAPSEQMEQNMDKIGPWTDMFALGATLFFLLTRKVPPSPSDIAEDENKALAMPADVDQKLQNLIRWLMKPNRTKRPQSVEEVNEFLTSDRISVEGDDALDYDPNTFRTIEIHSEKKKTETSVETKGIFEKLQGKKYLLGIVCVVVLLALVLLLSHNKTKTRVSPADSTNVEMVEKKSISLDVGPDNMRKFTYTGEMSRQKGLPEGKGIAEYGKHGDTPAARYKGMFKDGLCNDDDASIVFETGDSYKGSFSEGYYKEGTFTLSNGQYYKGTFKNGLPYNGTWYFENGKVSNKVIDGVEQ